MAPDLRNLQKTEKRIRHTMTTIFQFTQDENENRDKEQVEIRLQMLESAFVEFNEVRRRIEFIIDDTTDSTDTASSEKDAEMNAIHQEVQNYYCRIKASLMRLRSTDRKDLVVEQSSSSGVSSQPKIKLPEIKLPSFSGKLNDWITFRDAFKSLIHHNAKLMDIDRFTYLRSALSGEALQEIGSIDLTASNYEVAWNMLENRFQNTKLIVKTHLDSLFSIESMKRESFESLNHIISEVDKNLQMLKKSGERTDDWSTILVHMVCARLDPVTLRLWETYHNSKEVPTFQNLMSFLRNHSSVLQSVGTTKPAYTVLKTPRVGVSHASMAGKCCFCSEQFHSAFICRKFQQMKISERYDAVKRNRLCINCLSGGHLARNCNKGCCRQCGRKHHTLLHANSDSPVFQNSTGSQLTRRPPATSNQQEQRVQPRSQSQYTMSPTHQQQSNTLVSAISNELHSTHPHCATDQYSVALPTHTLKFTPQVLLSTAIIRVEDMFGNTMFARALLDSCSQYCFVTASFSRKLKLREFATYLSVHGIGGSAGISKKAVKATITPRLSNVSRFNEEIQFYVLPRLTIPLPSESFDVAQLRIPEEIILADPNFNEKNDIDMIIGAEYYFELLLDGKLKLREEGPILQNTTLGWIVSGRVHKMVPTNTSTAAYHCSTAELNDHLTKFWELEDCHTKSTNSVEDSLCEEIFQKTITRNESGRFIVTLPKKEFKIQRLGDSKSNAEKRFLSLEKRFAINPELKEMYCEFIHEYQSMGHMTEVNDDCEDHSIYYLPHHAVIKPESTTTKLRVVFDGSCRTSTGVSLNDCLMVGPVVQNDLISITIRFRMHQLAIVADIAKMYRMIKMQQIDQNLQRILWRDNYDEPIRSYKLTTVTYGTASAPFLATRCLQQLASEGEHTHPNAAKTLNNDFYVDDLITGVDNLEEGRQLVREISGLLKSAGFILRKWNSNYPQVLSELPDNLIDSQIVHEIDSFNPTVKTLGLVWQPNIDSFRFNAPEWKRAPYFTKRIILSDASKLFDPLGLVGPVIVMAKLFIQKLWKLGGKWDEPLTEELQSFWQQYRVNLNTLDSFTIPRWVGTTSTCLNIEMHGFCDASEKAYGACIYLRCTHADLSVTTQLLISKSRVAPLDDLKKKKRKQSIPRLELSSALLLSHLYDKVKNSIQFHDKCMFWTDSTIVKCWLASVPSRWQVFIGNRVSEIQHLTKGCSWNHVPGTENPADILSRGTTAVQLQYHPNWFNGPLWLRQDPSTWPKDTQASIDQYDSVVLEERTSVSLITQSIPPNEIFSLRSSLTNLVRLVALIRRFRYNAKEEHRDSRKTGWITSEEYDESLRHLVHLSQQDCYQLELVDLTRGKQVKVSSTISSLNPKLIDGIIRVGGRLSNALIAEDRKHPMIIDHQHPFATLLLRHYHVKLFHAGQQSLIANVRERFWVTSIRSLARKIIHSCLPCFRVKPRVLEQLMADLPIERVHPAPPFIHVGVDYCGPFQINYPNRRASPKKCFVSIFICFVTKAAHLELVADLTTDAFLAAFKRFVARRGRPAVVWCDNAKNFVGAKRELDGLLRLFRCQQFQNAVIRDSSNDRIDFKFIPARSPNFGGLWEAAVKSFKGAFKRTIGTSILMYDEMMTVLTQIEAVLNSRPLTPISNDPNDFEALTPGHFLVQRPLTAIAEPNLEEVPFNRLSMWQRAQNYVQILWKKWSTLYLSDLHNRTKWTRHRDNISVGTMVLLMDERVPPLKWRLGRINQIFRGSDGNIRVVDVRTQEGVYRRAISKICVLPIQNTATVDNEET